MTDVIYEDNTVKQGENKLKKFYNEKILKKPEKIIIEKPIIKGFYIEVAINGVMLNIYKEEKNSKLPIETYIFKDIPECLLFIAGYK